jgi:predicted phosphodiesterase
VDIQPFDLERAQALRRLWFLGDVHGHFDHIGPALEAAATTGNTPAWLVFLGDQQLSRPLRTELEEIRALREFGVRVAFIHGNHDADTHEHWEYVHDCGDAIALHGQVVELEGIRVAGLGGNFQGRVWYPPSEPNFRRKAEAMNRGSWSRRDGLRPNPKLFSAIYPDEVQALSRKRADILVTHEAPSCHPHGWPAIDDLARAMRVARLFHGHTHDDLSQAYTLERDRLGFDARAVDFCRIKNGLGETVLCGEKTGADPTI